MTTSFKFRWIITTQLLLLHHNVESSFILTSYELYTFFWPYFGLNCVSESGLYLSARLQLWTLVETLLDLVLARVGEKVANPALNGMWSTASLDFRVAQ